MSESKWFTKTIAREALAAMITELGDEISEQTAITLNGLFASKRKGGGATTTITIDGEIVGKKCSVLGRYLEISEFGTVGKNEDGSVKYSYQSKEGAKIARKKKSTLEEAINTADLELEETEDIQAWKSAKVEAKVEFDAEVVSELGVETVEEFTELYNS